jgi:hypothetical protein
MIWRQLGSAVPALTQAFEGTPWRVNGSEKVVLEKSARDMAQLHLPNLRTWHTSEYAWKAFERSEIEGVGSYDEFLTIMSLHLADELVVAAQGRVTRLQAFCLVDKKNSTRPGYQRFSRFQCQSNLKGNMAVFPSTMVLRELQI